jgi:hypothetical protein
MLYVVFKAFWLLRWLAELLRALILKLVRTNPAAQALW